MLACLPIRRNLVDALMDVDGEIDIVVVVVVSLAEALVGRKALVGMESCCSSVVMVEFFMWKIVGKERKRVFCFTFLLFSLFLSLWTFLLYRSSF